MVFAKSPLNKKRILSKKTDVFDIAKGIVCGDKAMFLLN